MLHLVSIALVCAALAFLATKRHTAWARKTLTLLWQARTEWLAVPLALVLFLASSAVLRAYDPTAGVFDIGVLQVLLVSALQLLVAMTTAQIATAISYRRLFKLPKTEPVCKTWYVALYALYFSGCVVLMAAL